MHIGLDASNVIDSTKSNTIEKWCGILRSTSKLTFLDLRPRKVNLAHILSNTSTIRMNIK